MMSLLGGSATPMGFGDVYTALQSKIIDGAENNEMALTDNGHGDVAILFLRHAPDDTGYPDRQYRIP